MSDRKQSNSFLLREIEDDLRRIKSDTAQIKLDLKVIIAKLQEKTKQEEKKQEDSWWLASFRR